MTRPITIRWILVCAFALMGDVSTVMGQEPCDGNRWLGLAGAPNARDAGGYITQSGARMKRGVLIRSDRLYSVTDEDCTQLKDLGLRTVIDLRLESDAVSVPDSPCVLEFARFHNNQIGIVGSTWPEVYLNIVNLYGSSIAQAFQTIADPENLPLLYHCAAGKDRAGTLTALIHTLLGVTREDIMADYLLSAQLGYDVDESWLQTVLDLVEAEGGIEMFLMNRGVDLETQQAVRRNLLEPATAVCDWMMLDANFHDD